MTVSCCEALQEKPTNATSSRSRGSFSWDRKLNNVWVIHNARRPEFRAERVPKARV